MPTVEEIRKALEAVIDPELHRSIVELDMIRTIDPRPGGEVAVTVSLTTAGCPIRSHFQTGVRDAVMSLEGVTSVSVDFDVLNDEQKAALRRTLGRDELPEGGARPGAERGLHRIRQGRRRQVHADHEPRRRAALRGAACRRARRGRVGLLDPPHARARRPTPLDLG